MKCEWAEEHLSEFLDNALDTQLHSELAEHLSGCSRCQAILDDYRRDDRVLASLPRIEPPDFLRARIFESPEYLALLEDLAREDDLITARSLAAYVADTADFEGTKSPLPLSPPVHEHTPASLDRHRSALPRWGRVAIPAAAAVLLALGASYAAFQHSGMGSRTTGPGVSTLGNPPPSSVPFPAGPRVVYERGGTLWSAPENGKTPAQALSAKGVAVTGWAISPLTGASDGRYVAYLDAQTGALHIVRSDGQDDHIIGRVVGGGTLTSAFWDSPAGQAINAGISWAPDGSRLAYLATDGSSLTLHIVNDDGSGDHIVAHGALVSTAVWRGDGQWLAYLQATPTGQSIWVVDLAGGTSRQIAAQADPTDVSASVRQLTWLATGSGALTLTWAARDGSTFTGIFAADASSGTLWQLSPDGAQLSAAAFSAAKNTWLVADGTALATVAGSAGGPVWTAAGTAPAAVTAIMWSPAGTNQNEAALEGDGKIMLWSAAGGVLLSQPASSTVVPVWSPDGSRLAYANGNLVIVLKPSIDGIVSVVSISAPGAQTIRWAPDGQSIAIADAAGVLVATSSGSSRAVIDSHAADGGVVAWSVSR
jgi:Tol biopolymer transport system component